MEVLQKSEIDQGLTSTFHSLRHSQAGIWEVSQCLMSIMSKQPLQLMYLYYKRLSIRLIKPHSHLSVCWSTFLRPTSRPHTVVSTDMITYSCKCYCLLGEPERLFNESLLPPPRLLSIPRIVYLISSILGRCRKTLHGHSLFTCPFRTHRDAELSDDFVSKPSSGDMRPLTMSR